MKDILTLAITALLGGGLGVTIVNAINERWKFKAQRKATKEDREAEQEDRAGKISKAVEEFKQAEGQRNEEIDKRLDTLETQMTAQSEALRLILLDRILQLGQSYIEAKEISYDDRRRFHMMHTCYHNGLGGNGDADLIVKAIDDLPVKLKED